MKTLLPTLQRHWQSRNPKERRALKALAAVLLLAGLLQLGWQAALGRAALRQQLPRLASAAETMQGQVQAWQNLAASQDKNPPSVPPAQVEQRLRALDKTVKIVWHGTEEVEIEGELPFDAWLKEIGELQREYRLIVVQLQALPAGPGRVALHARLSRAGTP